MSRSPSASWLSVVLEREQCPEQLLPAALDGAGTAHEGGRGERE